MTKEEILIRGAEKYGTPLYIFDTDQAAEQVKSFRKILGEKAGLCYAMKANPFLVKQMQADRPGRGVLHGRVLYLPGDGDTRGETFYLRSGEEKKKISGRYWIITREKVPAM